MNSFTFLVLTFNHQHYILEHLESIKYLIENFGAEIEIDIIIADDASRDETVALGKFWLNRNATLFRNIQVLSDGINRGTCKNLIQALEYLSTDQCKITAGDDVYSYENLFHESQKIEWNHILSGLPLNLINGRILNSKFDLFNLFASNIIYKHANYKERLKKINFFNAPSMVYSTDALLNSDVTNFVGQFSVTEDYPLQIKMAEIYDPLKFIQIEKIFVYYRRTSNSTFIIRNNAFNNDKLRIFEYLIKSENNITGRFLLSNRIFCYKLSNKYLKKLLNLNFYLYGFKILLNIYSIFKKFNNFEINLEQHQKHYDLIHKSAKKIFIEYSILSR